MRRRLAAEGTVDTDAPTDTTGEAATEGTAAPAGDIVVLYTNDVHCEIGGDFGYSNLAAYADEMEAAGDYVTIVDIGDAIQGRPLRHPDRR